MDTKLIVIFILSGVLGAVIVVTGCIKVLGKDGVLDMKSAAFILMGFIFVALPVLSTVSIEWGEFKFLVNTTNKEVKELQNTLDSLKQENQQLQADLLALQNSVGAYGELMLNQHFSQQQRIQASQEIRRSFEELNSRMAGVNSSLDSAILKNSKVLKDLEKFEGKRWYKKP